MYIHDSVSYVIILIELSHNELSVIKVFDPKIKIKFLKIFRLDFNLLLFVKLWR